MFVIMLNYSLNFHYRWFIILLFSLNFSPVVNAENISTTWKAFKNNSKRVVKIQVLEKSSVAKSGVGSGFFVSSVGHIVTNYHVVSEMVMNPENYRGECLTSDGESYPIELLAIDVLHDLAIVKIEHSSNTFFELKNVSPEQGERLLSLGHPFDIGLSIVEGTYNSFLKFSRNKRIHFTGSINPGMSGGPTISVDGQVVGINVSSAGNQVSFLVPVEYAIKLFENVKNGAYKKPGDFVKVIRDQLYSDQDQYYPNVLKKPGPTIKMGHYLLPEKISDDYKCWGNFKEKNDRRLFTSKLHACYSSNSIYISKGLKIGSIEYQHKHIFSEELNRFRFYSLLSREFKHDFESENSESDDDLDFNERKKLLTNFKCRIATLEHNRKAIRSVFCIRRYKKFDELYDVVFKIASLDQIGEGVISILYLPSISFENSKKVAERYLKGISWEQ
jgi:serine protease Do